jgi:hypothetical protein
MMWILVGALVGCQGYVAHNAGEESKAPSDAEEGMNVPPDTGKADVGQPPAAPLPATIEQIRKRREQERGQLSPEATYWYLQRLAPALAGRTLLVAEVEAIEAGGGTVIKPMLESWVEEDGFPRWVRRLVEKKLNASGRRDGINFNFPGNLGAHIARNDLPASELLTADYCVGEDGQKTECDTGAPYTAGVLTTRAYMISNASRFNLSRAGTLLNSFSCMSYPMPDEAEPRLDRPRLIKMFRTVDEAEDFTGGFGNGFACYTCHGQFGAHAQLFVKFNEEGLWRSDATGRQDPDGELGRSYGKLFASHMDDPQQARSEQSQYLGEPVENLSEAVQVLTKSQRFWTCSTRSLVGSGLNLNDADAGEIDRALLAEIVRLAKQSQVEPTFAHLSVVAFSHPSIIRVISDVAGDQP